MVKIELVNGGMTVEKLKFYKKEPSLIKKALFLTMANSVWLAPAVVPLAIDPDGFHLVLGAYGCLAGAMIFSQTRELVLKLDWLMRNPYRKFKHSRDVSRVLRATMENAGLVDVKVEEYMWDGQKKKREVVIFPRCEIQVDNYNYYIEFRMLPGQTVSSWENKASAFSSALGCDLVKYEIKRGIVTVVLQYTELTTDKVPYKRDDEHYLALGFSSSGPIKWEFDSEPHLLIIGPTRQGKSTFMRNLMIQFQRDWNVKIVDGKIVEFVFMRDYGFEVWAGYDWREAVQSAWEEMNERYQKMHEEGVNHYCKTGYKPYFLVIDEYLAIVESLQKKEREELFRMLTDIAVKGGACGVNLILILQRPDASFLPTVVRDNTLAKVVLGRASETCYEMAFGSENKKLEPLRKGQGYCMVGADLMTFSFANYEQERFMEDLRFISRKPMGEGGAWRSDRLVVLQGGKAE